MGDTIQDIKQRTIEKHEYELHNLKENTIYLKKIINDTRIISRNFDNHMFFNLYFDKIYVLNLDQQKDKWNKTKSHLEQNNIFNFTRFVGIDGKTQTNITKWNTYIIELKRKQHVRNIEQLPIGTYISSTGSYAILESVRNMIIDAKQNRYETIVILQDDIILCKDFCKRFHQFYLHNIANNNPQWKIIYLGASQHEWSDSLIYSSKVNGMNGAKREDGFYIPNGTTDGAFAFILHQSVYDELLKEIDKKELSIDSGPLSVIQRKYYDIYKASSQTSIPQVLVCYPNLVISDVSKSDLRKPRSMIETAKRFRWDLNKYDITYELF